jgi:hypothetical protein
MQMPWTAHEWLSEVAFAGIFYSVGQLGILAFSFVVEAFLLWYLMFKNKQSALEHPVFTILMFVTVTWTTYLFCYGRPQLFSFILFIFLIDALYRFRKNEKSKAIYFIPLIAILWANFHGGSSNLVYIFCLIFAITGLFNGRLGRLHFSKMTKRQVITYFIIAFVSIAAISINPYGPSMILYPYSNMGDTVMMSVISEWRVPELKHDLMLFIPVLFASVCICTSRKDLEWTDIAIFGSSLALFLISVRFITFFTYAMPFYLYNYIPDNDKKSKSVSSTSLSISKTIKQTACIICLFTLFISCFSVFNFSKLNGQYIMTQLDDEMIEYIKKDSPKRMYNYYNFGEALVFNDIPCWIDGRADMYSPYTIADTKMLENVDGNSMDTLLEKYHFDAFLVCPNTALDYYLSHSEKYKLNHETKLAKYYTLAK